MFKKIKKRDGTIVEFDSSKITSAITKAGKATGEFGENEAKKLSHRVINLTHELRLGPIPDVDPMAILSMRPCLAGWFQKEKPYLSTP